jgi:hypothetical protein
MERIQPTDGEGKDAIGNFIHTQNAWTELNGLMMALELPGIYLQTDTGKMFVFDHVEARVARRDRSGATLSVTNRTPYDAKVSLLAESGRASKRPLGYADYLRWQKISVKAGTTVQFRVTETTPPR